MTPEKSDSDMDEMVERAAEALRKAYRHEASGTVWFAEARAALEAAGVPELLEELEESGGRT